MPDTANNDENILAQYGTQPLTQKQQQTIDEGYSPLDLIGKKFQMGADGVANSRWNAFAMFRTDLSDDQELDMINQGSQKMGTGFSQSAYESQPWYLRAVDDASQMLPGIGDSIAQGTIGGITAVGANAATLGGVAGGIAKINPAAGAAVGGVGTGAVFGAGYSIGSAKSIWEQSAGEMYGELRQSGVKRDVARNLAFTFGSLNASLEFVGLHTLNKVAGSFMSSARKEAIQKTLNAPMVKKIEQNMLTRLGMKIAEETATETVTEGAQQGNTELAKVVAGMVQKGNAEAFTNWGQAKTNIKDSMLQALGASAVLGLGGAVGGHAAGTVAGRLNIGREGSEAQKFQMEMLNQLEGKSAKEILQIMNEGINKLPDPWETEADKSSTVHYDEAGNPYIKAGVTEQAQGTVQQTTMNAPNRPIDAGQAVVDKLGQMKLADIVKDPQTLIDEGLQAIYPQEQQATPEDIQSGQMRLPLVEWRNLNDTELQARQQQISTDLKTLNKERVRLADQILLDEKTGSKSFRNIKKWEKLNQAITELESERDLLDKDFNSPAQSPNERNTATTDIQANQMGQMRIKKLTKIMDKLTKTAEKLTQAQQKVGEAQQIGFDKGAYKQRQSIQRIQADLKNAVNISTEDPGIRARVRQYIAGVTTPEQAKKAIEVIKDNVLRLENAKFEKQQKTEQAKVFKAVVDMVTQKAGKVQMQSGHPVARLPIELVNKLDTLKGFLKSEKDLKDFETNFAQQYGSLDISELPVDVADTMQLAAMARNLYSGDALSRNVTAANISQWIYDGKAEIEQKREALRIQKQNDIDTAKSSLNVEARKNTNWVKNTGQRRSHFINDINAPWLTWNTLLDRISPKDQNHEISKQLDDHAEREAYLGNVDLATINLVRSVQDNMAAAGFKGNLMQKIADDSHTDFAVRFKNRQGSYTTETMSKANILDLVMKFRDQSLHPALTNDVTGNGYTLPGEVPAGESTLEVLSSTLSNDDIAFIDGVMGFYQDYHASINQAYKAKYGVDLPMRENYSPVTRAGFKVDSLYSQEGLQLYSLLPGSAKTRENSLLRIQPQNPMEAAHNHISQWEYFRAYDSKLTQINNVMTNPEIRQHIRDEFGSGTLQVMDNYVERFIKNDPIPSDPSDSLWGALRADFSRSVLAGKHVTGALTQFSSGSAMWANYNPIDIIYGLSQTVLHPVQTEKAISSSATLKERYRSGQSIELQAALRNQGLFGTTLHKIFGVKPEYNVRNNEILNKIMYAGYSAGDAGVARVFGGAVYHAEIKNGATPEQALITVNRLMDQTQQSSAVSQVPQAMTNPMVSTLIAPFAQQPIQVMGRAQIHLQDFLNGPKTPDRWMKLGHQIAMNWVVPGLLIGLVKTAPSWLAPQSDDDDRKRAQIYDIFGSTVLGPINQLPKIGDVAQMIWFALSKPLIGVDQTQRTDYIGKDPFVSYVLNDLYGSFKMWSALNKENDPMKLPSLDLEADQAKETKAYATYTRAVAKTFGLPEQLGNIPLIVTDRLEQNDPAGAALSLGGWSPGSIKQRNAAEEDLFSSQSLNLDTNETPYDTIETYLNTYFSQQPKEKTDSQSSKEYVDSFIKEMQKQ